MPDPTDAFMRDSDAFSWYMERDPVLRSTIVAVAWLDGAPEWAVLLDRVERASRAIPLFRSRVAEPPARLAPPRWVEDADLDLTWHLRRIAAPEPRTPSTVLDVARLAATTAFDPAHPLWEFTLVEGLTGGRAALVMKLHHALTDGIGGMELALRLFDADPAASREVSLEPLPEVRPGHDVAGLALLREGLAHDWSRVLHAVGDGLRRGPGAAAHAALHPVRTANDLAETARSVGRTVAPLSDTWSPVMAGRGLRRHLDLLCVDLDGLRTAVASGGGTLNDGYLTALTGGLRAYHVVHGTSAEELRVTLPISIRTPEDPEAGNRIALQRVAVPLLPVDPRARLGEIGRRCRAARAERSLPHTDAIAGALDLLPPGVVGGILKHVDFLASNVPGFPYPVHLGGARVTAYVPFGPTIGASLNATLLSYDGTCFVGVNIDEDAVGDPDVLMRCLVQGFDEVLALGGGRQAASLPIAGGRYPGDVDEPS